MAHRSDRRRDALRCCPACAASVLGSPCRRARPSHRWTWLALLAAVAAMVPLAARQGGGGAVLALAAPIPTYGTLAVVAAAAAPSEAPPTVRWRESDAIGSPNAGRLEDGVRLPLGGTGFYTYDPTTQQAPGAPDRTWGTARLVREILALGAWWARTHPARSPIGIGDLSREHGGPFTGPDVGHLSHQNGLDVDIRLVRRDGARAAADPATYDRRLTQEVVDRLVARGASLVLIGPNLDLHGPAGVVVRWPNHDDHLHVRFD